jgi:hypothetical protein
MISCAAIATDCKPDEQKRLTVVPATVTGSPARIAAMRIGTTENHIFDFSRVKLRRFGQDLLNAMRGQIIWPRHVERAAKRLGQRSPRAGDDDGFSHGKFSTS